MSRLRIYGVARTRAFRAIWMATEFDAATPADATRMIARINRL